MKALETKRTDLFANLAPGGLVGLADLAVMPLVAVVLASPRTRAAEMGEMLSVVLAVAVLHEADDTVSDQRINLLGADRGEVPPPHGATLAVGQRLGSGRIRRRRSRPPASRPERSAT